MLKLKKGTFMYKIKTNNTNGASMQATIEVLELLRQAYEVHKANNFNSTFLELVQSTIEANTTTQ